MCGNYFTCVTTYVRVSMQLPSNTTNFLVNLYWDNKYSDSEYYRASIRPLVCTNVLTCECVCM